MWAPAAGHLSDRSGRLPFLAGSGAITAAAVAGLALVSGVGATLALAVAVFLGGTALRVALDAGTIGVGGVYASGAAFLAGAGGAALLWLRAPRASAE